jgi:predicted nucleic acid-binding protein
MPELILPDTSSLIFLGKIGRLEMLLVLYEEVLVTDAVVLEHIAPLPDWVNVTRPSDLQYQELLEQSVDPGEASIIALAMERKNCVVSLDDLRARKLAKSLGLRFTGTLGLLHKGKMAGIIPSIHETLNQLKGVDFRISEEVEKEVLRMSGEL